MNPGSNIPNTFIVSDNKPLFPVSNLGSSSHGNKLHAELSSKKTRKRKIGKSSQPINPQMCSVVSKQLQATSPEYSLMSSAYVNSTLRNNLKNKLTPAASVNLPFNSVSLGRLRLAPMSTGNLGSVSMSFSNVGFVPAPSASLGSVPEPSGSLQFASPYGGIQSISTPQCNECMEMLYRRKNYDPVTNRTDDSYNTLTPSIAPTPPNWENHSEDVIMSLLNYKLFPIDPSTDEYKTIATMISPLKIKSVSQVVNPDLWKRFSNTRKEMLRSKTDDLKLLKQLGFDEREIMQCAHRALNFTKDRLITPYSDNMALLFHCTRQQSSIDSILSQGLDERLSNSHGGLLGKGIYFADDPRKSIQYDGANCIFIFAVLLGDCISVDSFPNKSSLIREPQKLIKQKRNSNDQFFDSIVARPGGYNEYVIYNRYQCCPLYQIYYDPVIGTCESKYSKAAKNLPPIAWIPPTSNTCHMPIQNFPNQWPFYAANLFRNMGAILPQYVEKKIESNAQIIEQSIDDKLEILTSLGFFDQAKNKEILAQFKYDIDRTVNFLLDNEKVPSPSSSTASNNMPSTSGINKSTNSTLPHAIPTIDLVNSDSDSEENGEKDSKQDKNKKYPGGGLFNNITEWALQLDSETPSAVMDDCDICCNEYESFATSPQFWKELDCTHRLCLSCHGNIQKSRKTMSGIEYTSTKCPFCQEISGVEVGICPDGQMIVVLMSDSCESFEGTNSISIRYYINSQGYNLNRTAYLPNTAEGQEVLKLLKVAWDRRLCFTIGTSATTGRENVVVWNIHHKTSLRGGVANYGYPDPGYMNRVKCELKAHGIE